MLVSKSSTFSSGGLASSSFSFASIWRFHINVFDFRVNEEEYGANDSKWNEWHAGDNGKYENNHSCNLNSFVFGQTCWDFLTYAFASGFGDQHTRANRNEQRRDLADEAVTDSENAKCLYRLFSTMFIMLMPIMMPATMLMAVMISPAMASPFAFRCTIMLPLQLLLRSFRDVHGLLFHDKTSI